MAPSISRLRWYANFLYSSSDDHTNGPLIAAQRNSSLNYSNKSPTHETGHQELFIISRDALGTHETWRALSVFTILFSLWVKIKSKMMIFAFFLLLDYIKPERSITSPLPISIFTFLSAQRLFFLSFLFFKEKIISPPINIWWFSFSFRFASFVNSPADWLTQVFVLQQPIHRPCTDLEWSNCGAQFRAKLLLFHATRRLHAQKKESMGYAINFLYEHETVECVSQRVCLHSFIELPNMRFSALCK